jgi:hypothetical protein
MSQRLAIAALFAAAATTAPHVSAGTLTCKLTFDMSGWSAFYKTASGTGTVQCDNGQRMAVKVGAKGGGLTVGKSRIRNGFGQFGNVDNIRQVLGSYIAAEAHAGTEKSAEAKAMTNGIVSLALSGTGEGWNLGVAFSRFTIEAR